MQSEFAKLQDIKRSAILVPFDRTDLAVLTEWANKTRRDGRDFTFSKAATADRDTATWLRAGMLFLHSRALEIDILISKAKNEKRTLRQDTVYRSFIGSYSSDQWTKGAETDSLAAGLRIIGGLTFPAEGERSSIGGSGLHYLTKS